MSYDFEEHALFDQENKRSIVWIYIQNAHFELIYENVIDQYFMILISQ